MFTTLTESERKLYGANECGASRGRRACVLPRVRYSFGLYASRLTFLWITHRCDWPSRRARSLRHTKPLGLARDTFLLQFRSFYGVAQFSFKKSLVHTHRLVKLGEIKSIRTFLNNLRDLIKQIEFKIS